MTFKNILVICGWFLVAGLGAAVGGWITNNTAPVQFLSRKVLTPIVKPGDPIKIELDNYRVLRCPQRVWRILTKPNGERTTMQEDKPAAFGKLGRDKYITSIDTPTDAGYGKGSLYSYTERMCNPWEYWSPVTYGEFYDEIEFGPETVRIEPEDAKNNLVK